MNFNFFTGIADIINNQFYGKLDEKINNVIYNLKKSIESLDDIDGVLMKYYNINDDSVNDISVKLLKNELINRVSYLENTIIPSINSKKNS